MKRMTLMALLVAAVTAVVATPLASGKGDAKGPACADIANGGQAAADGYVSDSSGGGTFNFSMDLSAAPCASYTYTFYVSTDGGSTFTAVVGTTDGSTRVTMPTQTYASPAPGSVCVYAESTKPNGNVADRAPDTGCLSYILDSSPGNSSFS